MAQILSSRLRRFEEKKLRTRLFLVVIGTLALVSFLAVFGFKLLIGFFVLLDQLRGTSKAPAATTKTQSLAIPPFLDSLPLATSSGRLSITGRGQAKAQLVLYVNEEEKKRVPINDDGTFTISSITFPEGDYILKAKTADANGKLSDFSNSIHTSVKRKPPAIELTAPEDNASVTGDSNIVTIEGKTEDDVDIRVNDRYVVVRPDNTFSYPFPLQDGDNTITIKAIDRAGNSTQVVRKVTYKK
jgi:hypothetical protein